MSDYIDAILHIADLPTLIAAIASVDPGMVSEDGIINGFNRTPMKMLGKAALVYVRMTPAEAAQWRGTPLVTILAEAPYVGETTPDSVYAALEANTSSMALYKEVYPRTPVVWTDGEGQEHTSTPPFRFGVIG